MGTRLAEGAALGSLGWQNDSLVVQFGWAAVYLRQTKRKNKDGTVAHYLQLAHNVRDPETGVVSAKILHSFGRAEHLERESLQRLIGSIARYLEQDPPLLTSSTPRVTQPSLGSGEVEPVDARNLGGAWVLDQLWRRLGIDTAIKKVARGRRFDARRVERTLFALVASRALAPSSKLEVTRWIGDDVHIGGLDQVDADGCYRAMDFLLEALEELQQTVFFTAADLLSLDVDLIFFDTTSTYFELDFEDGELDDDHDEGEEGLRRRGHSKDFRPDLPQVVIGMAVTTGGLPVRLWVWPGNTTDAPSSSRSGPIWRVGSSTAPYGSWTRGSPPGPTARSSPPAGRGSSSLNGCAAPTRRSSRPARGRVGSARSTSTWRSRTSSSARGRRGSGS